MLSALISRLKAVQEDRVREHRRQEQTPASLALVLDSLAAPLTTLKAESKRLEQAIRDHIEPPSHLKRDQ